MTTTLRDAARADALGQLAAYRDAKNARDDAIRAAYVAGASMTEIAEASGMTRQGVALVLKRTP